MQASSSLGKNMEVLLQNNPAEEMDKLVEQVLANKQTPVRIKRINMTYSRIASTASWFGTRGKSVNLLIQRVKVEKNVNIVNHRNETPLIIASQLGAYGFASLILTQKPLINAQDEKGYTALHYAIEANALKLVQELLKNNADVNAQTKEGNTPMHIAVQLNNLEIGRAIRKSRYFNQTILNNEGDSALISAVKQSKIKMLTVLLKSPDDYNKQDKEGKTPLHYACINASPCILHRLQDKSLGSIKDIYGDIPLTIAIKYNNERAVDMLWHSVHFNTSAKDLQLNTLLHMACRHENVPLLEMIFSCTKDFDERNMYNETPLHIASSVNNLTAIKMLKEKYVDRNALDVRGQTPLIITASFNYTEASKELFDDTNTAAEHIFLNDDIHSTDVVIVNGETINIKTCILLDAADEKGNTALHYCSLFGNKELASFLIHKGARITVLNYEQDSPVTILAKLPSGYDCPIYTEVYAPQQEMPWYAPELDTQQLFPDEGQRDLETDLMFL
jgi:ankyrin repeat protein